MRALSRPVAALASAVLLWAAFFPGWGWLAWGGLVPLFWALDGAGGRRGAVLGLLFGVAFFGLEFSSLSSLGAIVGPVVALVCLGLAVYGGLFGLVFGAVGGRWSSPLLWAGAWTLLEALRAAGPLGFTFGSLPTTMVGTPFLPAAAVGGPWVLSLPVAWTAGCLARGLRDRRWLPGAAGGPLALLLLAALPTGTREAGVLRVALVQPNIPKLEQLDPWLRDDHLAAYRALLAALRLPLDLAVLPENALPWLRSYPEEWELFAGEARRLGVPLALGSGDLEGERVYNRVFLLGPDGEVVGSYAKSRLVPFGEYVPGREVLVRIGLGSLIEPFLPFDQTPGEAVAPVGTLGFMICFESTFPGVARELVLQGAEVLLIPTNDAWFGRTRILWEHYAFAALRAVEVGRTVVQVGHTGVSGGWDPRGRELGRLPPWTRGTAVLEVPVRTGLTPYARGGDGPALAVAGLAALGGLWARRPRRGRGRPRSVAKEARSTGPR
ncbi:MAG: apolipoprotein N-acyltransferase [Candidatus Bipolaricaulota bacterium]|nr:apolipoprotein N-acyltransferase [Candidatus Bipolaricaulota bacterium]